VCKYSVFAGAFVHERAFIDTFLPETVMTVVLAEGSPPESDFVPLCFAQITMYPKPLETKNGTSSVSVGREKKGCGDEE